MALKLLDLTTCVHTWFAFKFLATMCIPIIMWHYTPHPPTVLTITASITSPTGSFTVGQSYTLTCTANVTGGDTMSTTTITWIRPSGSVTSGTGSSLDLSLNPLRVSDGGQYTCNVSVSSPFLTGAHSFTDMLYVNVHGMYFKLWWVMNIVTLSGMVNVVSC